MRSPEISDRKMDEIIKEASREDTLENAISAGIKMALEEKERLEAVLRRREGCFHADGHVFILNGDSGMIETEIGGGAARMKWRGSGDCENCDAHLGVTYMEVL